VRDNTPHPSPLPRGERGLAVLTPNPTHTTKPFPHFLYPFIKLFCAREHQSPLPLRERARVRGKINDEIKVYMPKKYDKILH